MLNNLPLDILEHILSYFTGLELIEFKLISRKFNKIIENTKQCHINRNMFHSLILGAKNTYIKNGKYNLIKFDNLRLLKFISFQRLNIYGFTEKTDFIKQILDCKLKYNELKIQNLKITSKETLDYFLSLNLPKASILTIRNCSNEAKEKISDNDIGMKLFNFLIKDDQNVTFNTFTSYSDSDMMQSISSLCFCKSKCDIRVKNVDLFASDLESRLIKWKEELRSGAPRVLLGCPSGKYTSVISFTSKIILIESNGQYDMIKLDKILNKVFPEGFTYEKQYGAISIKNSDSQSSLTIKYKPLYENRLIDYNMLNMKRETL
uniref:F-box domain-containing protein n=1 Tax=viral metagenome TaxID=1070528 RepID=A0A6C0JVF0_9ZZZZ